MTVATHESMPIEALELVRANRSAPTHDVFWDADSYDRYGRPAVVPQSLQAYSAEHAAELAGYCRADAFRRNVRVVARVRS